MIDVIVSSNCPHCVTQVEAMEKSFFTDEYRIINVDSTEFASYSSKEIVDAVPFVVVKKDDGSIRYAAKGVHDGTELRKIERGSGVSASFNLRKARALVAH